jgi:hypothetical protein
LGKLNHSSLKYCSSGPIDTALWHSDYSEHTRLNLDLIEVADPNKCMERTLIDGDTTCVASTFIAQYVATQIGKRADKKLLCTLDENIFSINMVFRFTRGLRVSDRFNTVIRRCIEAGLGDKYWSDLIFNLKLQNMRNSGELYCQACSSDYFVFSHTHLRVVFIALGFGYMLSVAVFVAELICNWFSKRRTVTVIKPETPPFPFLHQTTFR